MRREEGRRRDGGDYKREEGQEEEEGVRNPELRLPIDYKREEGQEEEGEMGMRLGVILPP